jgi:hypothetical protein
MQISKSQREKRTRDNIYRAVAMAADQAINTKDIILSAS